MHSLTALQLLKQLEWCNHSYDPAHGHTHKCPCCAAPKGSKHAADCELEVALHTPQKFLVGQRVIYSGAICVIVISKNDPHNKDWDYYIDNPAAGYTHGVAKSNLQPLPGGQL